MQKSAMIKSTVTAFNYKKNETVNFFNKKLPDNQSIHS